MTRAAIRKQVNRILSETTKGLHSDEYWKPVHEAFKTIREAGFDFTLMGANYRHENGIPVAKEWKFEIETHGKPLYGILIASGAGTMADPLSQYDIVAYVS